MVGKIRTHEYCPVCKGKFATFDRGLICLKCNTKPSAFYIDLSVHGKRYKLYRNREGLVLGSYSMARKLYDSINEDIAKGIFQIENYLHKEVDAFRGKTLLDKWVSYKTDSAPTYYNVLRGIVENHLKPFFGSIDMRHLATYHVEDFAHSLNGLHPKTIKNILGVLHTFCSWLLRREVIAKMPTFPTISPPQPQIQWLDAPTQKKVLDCIPEPHKAIFAFLMAHPLRPGEARALKVKDFHLDEGWISVERAFSGKEERCRKGKVPYTIAISSAFDTTILADKLPEAYVFTFNGRPYSHSTLRKVWESACRRAGVEGVSLYQGTRHSAATQSILSGVDLAIVSKALGHSTMQMTTRYAKIDYRASRQVVDRVVSPFARDERKAI